MIKGAPDDEIIRCKKWIKGALKLLNTHNFSDIRKGILNGVYTLWPAPDGCLVTEFVEYPKMRVLNVFLGGGKLERLIDMRQSIESFAIATGCKKLSITGREGWAKVFLKDGLVREAVVMSKEL